MLFSGLGFLEGVANYNFSSQSAPGMRSGDLTAQPIRRISSLSRNSSRPDDLYVASRWLPFKEKQGQVHP
ncbi:hypothetical protein TNCV_43351 [Trichonephila clavipes]|nr:hypothetical protein TNCV_43351 [Trichonephila clavipes]